MATISDLVAKLKLRAKILPEERLSSSTPLDDFLAELIEEAVTTHNPALTVPSLPAAEERLVLILAQIEVCYVRAENAVNTAATQAGGNAFSVAADAPFNKNVKLAEELIKRYNDLVDKLGVYSGAVGIIAVSTVYKKSDRLDAIFPYFNAPPAPAAIVTATLFEGDPSTQIWIDWSTTSKVDYFYRYWVFVSLTPGIYQDWNAAGKMTVPRIKSSAILIFDTHDQFQQAIVGEDFEPDTDYYIMVVTQTQTVKFTYSDEVLIRTEV